MKTIKSIPAKDVELMTASLEKSISSIEERAGLDERHAHSVALGMAESTIEHTIKQLKGEYPII